jgi:tetratricopeptide (TPR) repeat protein
VSIAIGNIGNVYAQRGEHDRALECYGELERIGRELGDRRGMSIAIGNMGDVYTDLGEYDRALECLHHAAEEHRAIGFRYGLSYWLEGTARVLLELAHGDDAMPAYVRTYLPDVQEAVWQTMALEHARACAEDGIAISEELSKPDTQFSGRVLLCRIESAEGDSASARRRLQELLESATDDAQRAEVHYWLFKLGLDPDADHRDTAMALYTELYKHTPNHAYHKRIEELSVAVELSQSRNTDGTKE